MRILQRGSGGPDRRGGIGITLHRARKAGRGAGCAWPACALLCLAVAGALLLLAWQPASAQTQSVTGSSRADASRLAPAAGPHVLWPTGEPGKALSQQPGLRPGLRSKLPPRVARAQRFLAQRGWTPGRRNGRIMRRGNLPAAEIQPGSTNPWKSLGPDAVLTPGYGLVTGRVSSLAIDPSDSTGNHLYIGTTGGGVWEAQNAAVSNASLVVFTPLTDSVGALGGAMDASSSIGALTVQPGGTGVILAGTGDPNDALDSYYGAGILRSGNGGSSWTLIPGTSDGIYSFAGEGFAGFA